MKGITIFKILVALSLAISLILEITKVISSDIATWIRVAAIIIYVIVPQKTKGEDKQNTEKRA